MAELKPRIGVVAVGRDTFDVPFAEEVLAKAWESLGTLDADILGKPALCFTADAAREACDAVSAENPDILLLLQVTFTDASLTVELAEAADVPLVIWSFPEARTGGRLRLNSFCGLNLAGHALSRANVGFQFVHGAPDSATALKNVMELAVAGAARKRLQSTRIAVVGEHPTGFPPCDYNQDEVKTRFGVTVDAKDWDTFLEGVKSLPDSIAEEHYAERAKVLENLDEMEREPTLKTLKVYEGLSRLTKEEGYNGVAVRCWPEFFTKYGCAACGALAMMNEKGFPCGCEADTYGVMTSLLLQWVSGENVFNTDLVDMDTESDTCVFWHCGQAPVQMADPDEPVRATIHSNRKLPLLNEFPMKPGRFTLVRISRGHGETRMVLGGGDMQKAPLAFSGTAGVARLDSPVAEVLDTMVTEGLEHHTAIAYGDHRPVLRRLAAMLGLPVVELTA